MIVVQLEFQITFILFQPINSYESELEHVKYNALSLEEIGSFPSFGCIKTALPQSLIAFRRQQL